jgi:hypothetical protein
MSYITEFPSFLFALLQWWITLLTGSVIAVIVWLVEHRRGAISWKWSIGVALFTIFLSSYLAWVDTHQALVAERTDLAGKAESRLQLRRAQKAQLQRLLNEANYFLYRQLPHDISDHDFQNYSEQFRKWVSETATYILENFGQEKEDAFLITRQHAITPTEGITINDKHEHEHLEILLALKSYTENLKRLINEIPVQ